MMLLVGCFEFETQWQVEDPNHPDFKHLAETDWDRDCLEKFVRFFRNRGARNMKVEDFEWAWSIDMNPSYLKVRPAILLT